MALARTIPEVRNELYAMLVEDLPATLAALNELLPETCDKHAMVTALKARLQQLNKDRILGVIDASEYGKRVAVISADCYSLIKDLEVGDFEHEPASAEATAGKAGKQGSVLYRVPHQMPLRKPSICIIRVAIDENAILEDIVLDDDVRLRQRVEVSDRMSAELLDTEGDVFEIVAFNASQQKVRDSGYTQWLFRVTPHIEGEHQLLVKVSLLEFDPNTRDYVPRDVSIMETVMIVTEGPAPSEQVQETPLKSSGHQFFIGPNPSRTTNRIGLHLGLRALVIFLGFLILTPSAIWALAPELSRDFLLATWQAELTGKADGFNWFIQKHKKEQDARPYLEKAYFRKAELTESLIDLRAYQREFPDGEHIEVVLAKIRLLEAKFLENIQQNPESTKIRQFIADFQDAEYLPELKQIVETHLELQNEFIPLLENAYVTTMQVQPSEHKASAYLRGFPKQERLNEIADAAATQPHIFQNIQPELEDAYLKKLTQNPTIVQAMQFLQRFPHPVRRVEFEKILAQILAWKKVVLEGKKKNLLSNKHKGDEKVNSIEPQPSIVKTSNQRIATEAIKDAKRLIDSVAHADSIRVLANQQHPEVKAHLDSDGDGIPDKEDRCPNIKGNLADLGCPPKLLETPTSSHNRNLRSGLEMLQVEGGSFRMGGNDDRSEKPIHKVKVPSFNLGKYEVTQADWRSVMGSDPPDLFNIGCDECPVENVSWNDVQDFIKQLNLQTGNKYRLPSEAEWEYASRGGNKSNGYAYAGGANIDKVACYNGNYQSDAWGAKRTTHKVGERNANELGFFDMSGNVWEWCEDDWHDNYWRAPINGRAWVKSAVRATHRVYRGGSWNVNAPFCRVSYRNHVTPEYRINYLGFRLASSPQ